MPKPITITLPPEDYRRLTERAAAQDRDPHQEARHVLREALRTEPQREGQGHANRNH